MLEGLSATKLRRQWRRGLRWGGCREEERQWREKGMFGERRTCLEKSEEEREKAGRVIWCGGCMKDWTCVIYLVVYWLYLMYCTGCKFFPNNYWNVYLHIYK